MAVFCGMLLLSTHLKIPVVMSMAISFISKDGAVDTTAGSLAAIGFWRPIALI
jgi:hypothetical protein